MGVWTAVMPTDVDEKLETAIDAVGRHKVFKAVAHMGYCPGDNVPKEVWWAVVERMRLFAPG